MVTYFSTAPPADVAWATFFLTGRRLKRLLPGRSISQWAMTATGMSEWLLSECYAVVGDGAETATLILDQLPPSPSEPLSLAEWVEQRILPLRDLDPHEQQRRVLVWVRELTRWERFTLLKLLTGELRLGVSQTLVVRALANAASLPATTMAALGPSQMNVSVMSRVTIGHAATVPASSPNTAVASPISRYSRA